MCSSGTGVLNFLSFNSPNHKGTGTPILHFLAALRFILGLDPSLRNPVLLNPLAIAALGLI